MYLQAYLGDHPEYYTGNCAVFAFGASDPLKLQLGIFWESSFNGVLPVSMQQPVSVVTARKAVEWPFLTITVDTAVNSEQCLPLAPATH